MKRLLAIAALLLASSAAQAQYSFEYGGAPFGSIRTAERFRSGVYDNTGRRAKRSHNNQDSGTASSLRRRPKAIHRPRGAGRYAAAPATPAPANSPTTSSEPSTTTANNTPAIPLFRRHLRNRRVRAPV